MNTPMKYFFLIVCSLYTYINILKLPNRRSVIKTTCIFLSFILSFLTCFLRIYMMPISIPGMLLFSFLAFTLLFRTPWKVSVFASILSFGCSYFFFAVSAVLRAAVEAFMITKLNFYPPTLLLDLFLGLSQLGGVICLFHTRRLKHGLSFLWELENNNAGVFIGAAILTAVSFLSLNNDTHFIYYILIFSILIWGAALVFWWKERITRKYLYQINTRSVQEFEAALSSKDEEILYLKQQNDTLARIIHKDNKLIPAMEYSVRKLGHELEGTPFYERSAELLKELEHISQDRKGLLKDYETAGKQLPATEIVSVDILLAYMLQKAASQDIDFDVAIPGDIRSMIQLIHHEDLRTLLADLLENALNAASEGEKKKVLLTIGSKDGIDTIEVYDSGPPFSKEVLSSFGVRPVTTRREHGGSGIGLMTISELCTKYSASFIIEALHDSSSYSKKISICFDGLNRQVF